jgi:hypothetical protein
MDRTSAVVRPSARPAECAIQKAAYKMRTEHHAVVEGESGREPRSGAMLRDADSFLVRYSSPQDYRTGFPILTPITGD